MTNNNDGSGEPAQMYNLAKSFLAAVSKFDIFCYIYEDSCKLVIMCNLVRASLLAFMRERERERERKQKKNILLHFQANAAPSSLCQCTASSELKLLALNERKIGKVGILKQWRLS